MNSSTANVVPGCVVGPVTQNCRGRYWQPLGPHHPAHRGEGEEKPGQEDVSQGNKVIAVGASQDSGWMPVP